MRRRRSREGAIYAEALLVLPVIGLVGSLTAYVHRGFDHALDAAVAVRGTAWAAARGACADDVPEHARADVERQDRDLFGGAERAPGAVVAARTRLFTEQPLLGARTSALAFEIASGRWSAHGTVARSGAIGGEATYGHQLALACDERHSEVNLGAWIAAAAGAP